MRTNIRQKYWREISNISNNAETYRNIREKYSIEIFGRNILQKYSRELKKKSYCSIQRISNYNSSTRNFLKYSSEMFNTFMIDL